ncbi:MAG: ArnT family glycosyltransferase [Cyanobacteriota bacterium]|jgi:4-amino-4-deoxy-L-arabinose transferase-like glycosyltransferase
MRDIPITESANGGLRLRSARNQDWIFLGGLTLGALLLAAVGLGNTPLRDWDEGYYGTVAQDMFQRGGWLYPTYQGEPFFLKPPLLFWLLLISYHLGDISEWTSRLPPAGIAALGTPLLYLLGRQLGQAPRAAFWSAAVYLTLLPAARLGRLAMFDGMINTFLILTLLCLLRGFVYPRWWLGAGLGLGAIALCKGVLALAFGGLIFLWLAWEGKLGIIARWPLWFGLGLGFAPVIGWYGLQFQRYGAAFGAVHFQSQGVNRLTTAVEGNQGAPWFYLLEMAKYTAPWLLFLPGGLVLAWHQRNQTWSRLPLTLGGGFFLLISLMGTKLPWYVLPVYPFYALLVGAQLEALWTYRRPYPRRLGIVLMILGVGVFGAGLYLGFQANKFWILPLGLTLFLGLGTAGLLLFRRRREFILPLLAGLYLGLGWLMISPDWNWEVNEAFTVKPVGALIRAKTPAGATIYASIPYSRPSLDFYSRRLVLSVGEGELQERAQRGDYLLLDPDALPRFSRPGAEILGQAGDFTLLRTAPNP